MQHICLMPDQASCMVMTGTINNPQTYLEISLPNINDDAKSMEA